MLLLHPTPTCPDAGLVLCSHLVLVLFSFHQLAQILHLHMLQLAPWCFSIRQLAQMLHLHTWWSSPAATCAGDVFPFQPLHRAHTPLALVQLALCGVGCMYVVVLVVYLWQWCLYIAIYVAVAVE